MQNMTATTILKCILGVSQIMATSAAIYQVDHSVDLPSHPKSLSRQHGPILASTIPMLIKIIELTVTFETNTEK